MLRPDGDDPEALAAWMQALSACRAAMAQFKQQVAKTADAITQDAQSHITQVQQQQRQVMGKVDSYLLDLSRKEVQVISGCDEQLGPEPAEQEPISVRDSLQQPQQEQGQLRHAQQGHGVLGQQRDELGHVLLSTEEPLSPTYTSGQLNDLQSAVQQLLQRPSSKSSHKSSCADSKRQRGPDSSGHAGDSSHQQQQQQEEDTRRAAKKRKLAAAAAACNHMVAAAAAAAVIVID